MVSIEIIRFSSISLLLTIILTGCASPPKLTEYEGITEGKNVFNDIAEKITASKKRTVAIIDFSKKKDGKVFDKGKNVAENMAVFLNQKIGIEEVWIESGKDLGKDFMNALEKNRIIENGEIAKKEPAKKLFWQKMGIEAVITGFLDPHINGTHFFIALYDVQNDKVIQRYKGTLPKKDEIVTKGSQSLQSTGTSRYESEGPFLWKPPIPSDKEPISPDFLEHYKNKTLADLGAALQKALSKEGFRTSYLAVPEGFALISDADNFRFSVDDIPISPSATKDNTRFNFLEIFRKNFWKTSFKVWIKGPLERPTSRVVCVVVTSGRVCYPEQPGMTPEETRDLLINFGRENVPEVLKKQEYIEGKYKCIAMLYVFEKDPSGDGKKMRFVPFGHNLNERDKKIRIHEHLQKTGFWDKS
ncbi:MAG: hypothetical protein D3904_01525 [Candidatus Electrothrix sp. EH2]|nr:hypothetical protein [Candidatus Electrothrix sp. EH2]